MYAAELINYALTLTSSISFIHTTHKANRNRMNPQKGGGSFGLVWEIVAMFLPFVFGVFQRFVLWTLCIYAPFSAGAFPSSPFFINITAQNHHHYQHLEGRRPSVKTQAQPIRNACRKFRPRTSLRCGQDLVLDRLPEWQPFTKIEQIQ